MRYRVLAIALSVAAHLAFFLYAPTRRSPAALSPVAIELELELRRAARVAVLPVVEPHARPSRTPREATSTGRSTGTRAPAPDGASALDDPDAPSAPSRAPTSGGAVDLFPRAALDRVVGAVDRGLGGAAGAATKQRVDGWLSDGKAEERAEKGQIDPAYRAIERALRTEFHPPKAIVKVGSWGAALRDQVRAFFTDPSRTRSAPPSRIDGAIEPRDSASGMPGGFNFREEPLQQQFAAQAALSKPVWLEVDIDVDVDASGVVQRATIRSPSGHRRFDRYALAEVERIVGGREYPVPGAARLGFRLRGAYVAKLPIQISGSFDETGMMRGKGWHRYFGVDNPAERIESEVLLVRFAPN